MTHYMPHAIACAKKTAEKGDVPVGAVLVHGETGTIIAQSGNLCEQNHDPSVHAEIIVIRAACAELKTTRLPEYDLYVTLEPCAMCAGAIAHARLRRLYFGAYDPKSGGVIHGAKVFDHPTTHHKPDIYSGIMERECAQLLTTFFQSRR